MTTETKPPVMVASTRFLIFTGTSSAYGRDTDARVNKSHLPWGRDRTRTRKVAQARIRAVRRAYTARTGLRSRAVLSCIFKDRAVGR